jgi:hypothetical protein
VASGDSMTLASPRDMAQREAPETGWPSFNTMCLESGSRLALANSVTAGRALAC